MTAVEQNAEVLEETCNRDTEGVLRAVDVGKKGPIEGRTRLEGRVAVTKTCVGGGDEDVVKSKKEQKRTRRRRRKKPRHGLSARGDEGSIPCDGKKSSLSGESISKEPKQRAQKKDCLEAENASSEEKKRMRGRRPKRREVLHSEGAASAPKAEPPPAEEIVHKRTIKIAIPEEPGSYKYIGRLVGPRGISIRELEHATRCKILIRGRGSFKDPEKEERYRNRKGHEHLRESLHVRVTTEVDSDYKLRLETARALINRLLQPVDDSYKQNQLVQLSIINGTYRPGYSILKENAEDSLSG